MGAGKGDEKVNLTEKIERVERLRKELEGAASILLTDLSGLDVETVNGLRAELRKGGIKYHVAKNTLIKRAVADTLAQPIVSLLVGPTALAWHDEEPAAAAKVFENFVKTNMKLTIKGGYIDGYALAGPEALETLAKMPSKDELRSQLLGLIKLVPGTFLSLVQTPPKKFYAVLEARKCKLEEEEEAA